MNQTPVGVLRVAIARGGHPSIEGRPGEIVEKLTPDQRATLCELRSADVAEGKIGRDVAWFGYGLYEPGQISPEAAREMLLTFDRKVLRIPAPRRMPRHERGQ